MGAFIILLIIFGIIIFVAKSYDNREEKNEEKIKLIKRVYNLEQQFLEIEEINKKLQEEIEKLKSGIVVKAVNSEEEKVEKTNSAVIEDKIIIEKNIIAEETESEELNENIVEKLETENIDNNKNIGDTVDIVINKKSNIEISKTEKALKLIDEEIEFWNLENNNIINKNEDIIKEEIAEETIEETIEEKNIDIIEISKNNEIKKEYQENFTDKIKSSEKFENLFSIESIISKLGIMLFIIGMAFLFKYTYSKGLITKDIRVGAGIFIGFSFAVLAEFMHRKNREKLGQIIAGGSIAIFYLTIFAAFYLYKMVGYEVAFGAMLCITALAYLGSMKYNSVLLSIVGFVGGMATPFMLYTGEGSISGLVMYNCFMIFGTAIIYIIKGWKSLLWSAVIGAWGILGIALFKEKLNNIELFWAISGTIFHWGCFWLASTFREIITAVNPNRWKEPALGYLERYMSIETVKLIKNHIHVITIVMPILAMALMIGISGIGVREAVWGWAGIGAALLYFVVAYILRKLKVKNFLEYSNILSGISLMLFSAVEFFKGDILAVSIICEGVVLIIAGYYLKDRFIKRTADIILAIGSSILIKRFIGLIEVDTIDISSILSYSIIAILGVIVVKFADEKLKKAYGVFYIQIVATLTIMLWSWYFSRNINYIIALFGLVLIADYFICIKKNILSKELIHITVAMLSIYKIAELIFSEKVTFNIGEMSLCDLIFVISIWIISYFEGNETKCRKNYRVVAILLLFGLLIRDGVNIKGGIDYVAIIFGIVLILLSYLNIKKIKDDYFALKPAITLFIGYEIFRYFGTFTMETKGVIPFITELFSILAIYIVSISENRERLKKVYGNIAVVFLITLIIRESGKEEYINWITPILLILNAVVLKTVGEKSYKKWITYSLITPFIGVIYMELFRLLSVTYEHQSITQFIVDAIVSVVMIFLSFKEKKESKIKLLKISGYFILLTLFVRDFYNIENGIQYIIISWTAIYLITVFAEKNKTAGFKIGNRLWVALLILTGGNIIKLIVDGNYPMFALSVNIISSITIIISSFIYEKRSNGVIRNSGIILLTLSLIEVIQRVREVSELNGILYIVLLVGIIWIVIKGCEERYNLNQPINRYISWLVIGAAIGDIIARINSNIDFERIFIQVLLVVILHIGAVIEKDKNRGEKIAGFLIPIILGYTYISLSCILLFLPVGGFILMMLQKIYKRYKKEGTLKAIEWLFYIYTVGMIFGVILLNGEKYGTTVGFILEIIGIIALTEIVRGFKEIKTVKFYEFLIHFLVIAAAYRNFADSVSGNGLVSLIWGIYGLGVIIYGIIKTDKKKIYCALAIIVVVALKLLLIDLSELEPIWKIFLFMGFGGALLAVSYYLHPLLQKDEMQ